MKYCKNILHITYIIITIKYIDSKNEKSVDLLSEYYKINWKKIDFYFLICNKNIWIYSKFKLSVKIMSSVIRLFLYKNLN